MTIREFQSIAESYADKGDYISCRCEMSHGSLEFAIWSGYAKTNFFGDSPEAALEKFRCKSTDRAPIDMEMSDEPTIIQATIPFVETPPLPHGFGEFNEVGSGPSNTESFAEINKAAQEGVVPPAPDADDLTW